MKKLNYDQIRDNINSRLKYEGIDNALGKDSQVFKCVILGLMNSINENIPESWVDSTLIYTGIQLQVNEVFTGLTYEFKNMDEFKCTKDYGCDITVMNSGNTFNVPKEWFRMKNLKNKG